MALVDVTKITSEMGQLVLWYDFVSMEVVNLATPHMAEGTVQIDLVFQSPIQGRVPVGYLVVFDGDGYRLASAD